MVKKVFLFLVLSRILIIFIANQHGILSLANQWDSPHYLYISEFGYQNNGDPANFIVFLPFYPFLITLFSVFIKLKIGSLIISNLAFILGGILFYKLLAIDYGEKFSFFAILVLAFFPTSYFFSSTYPESLYLMLFAGSFYLARKKNFVASGFAAGLLTLTRPFGILVWPSLIIEVLKSKDQKHKVIQNICFLIIFLIISLSIYLYINYYLYNDFFAFEKILQNHWQKSFIFPWEGIRQAWLRGINSNKWDDYRIFIGFAEAITATIAWIFVPIAFIKKLKINLSYSFYYALGVIMFTSTGFILSGPRYLLSLPPFFIIFTKIINIKIVKYIWIILSTILLIYLTNRFASGPWTF